MSHELERESAFEYIHATSEQFALIKDVAKLTSEAGDRMFADPMSAWARKLQVFVLGFSSITLLLASGLVSTVEVTSSGFKATGLRPECAALYAALITLGGILFYSISCYQDWTLHSIRSDESIKRTAEGSFIYSVEALEALQRAQAMHEADVEEDAERIRSESEISAKIKLLEEERSRGFFPSWKAVQLADLTARLVTSLSSKVRTTEAERQALRRRAALLEAASSSLFEFLTRYNSHLRLRVLVEVAAPIVYGCLSAWVGIRGASAPIGCW